MTISVIQTVAINNGFSGSFTSNVTIGNSIVMAVTGYNNNDGMTISSSAPLYNGASVTGAVKLTDLYEGDSYVGFWLLPNVVSSAKTLSITVTNSISDVVVGVVAWEVAGLGSSPALDKFSTATGGGTGVQSSGSSGNITSSPEFIAGAIVQDGTADGLPSSPWVNTTLPGNSTDNSFAGYQIATSSGSSYTYATSSSGSAGGWRAGVVAISASAPSVVVYGAQREIRARLPRGPYILGNPGLIYQKSRDGTP